MGDDLMRSPGVVQIGVGAIAPSSAELARSLRELPGDVRVVVVRFSSAPEGTPKIPDDAEIRDALIALARPDLASIAIVEGALSGPSTALVLGCDLRVLVSGATLRFDVGALGSLVELVGAVGYSRAAELSLTGRRLAAADAHSIGLANTVAAADEVDAAVADLVAELLATPRDEAIELKAALLACRDVVSRDRRAAAELDAAARLASSEPV